ncbi:MAG: thiamine diphosphokinase [Bacillota bacterium]|jgi:thiamine pyrophosphokinase
MVRECFLPEEKNYIAVVLGGDFPYKPDVCSVVKSALYCICADKGAEIAEICGRLPDFLVGDMDSVNTETLKWCSENRVPEKRFIPEKDYTDGEIAVDFAINYAKKNGIGLICVVGGCGNRFDHTLANIYIGKKILDNGLRVVYCNDNSFIYLLKGNCSQKVELINGKTVSLLPMGGNAEGVTLRGFKYPLHESRLNVDVSLGISNELISDIGTVFLRNGYLMVIQNR